MNMPSKYRQWVNKNAYRKRRPRCECCNASPRFLGFLKNDVHRILPAHLYPELAADFDNMITLCRWCHFNVGHLKNWKHYCSDIKSAIAMRMSIASKISMDYRRVSREEQS
jgi:hypothetical protein